MAVANISLPNTVSRSGWTANRIAPAPVTSSALANADQPITAAALATTPSTLNDRSLGSRSYQNPNTGIRTAPIQTSIYAQPNVPAFLNQAIADLNSEQALRRALQQQWTTRLADATGGPNGYLYAEALRAAVVQPGANVSFGSAITDPTESAAKLKYATGVAAEAQARANEIARPAKIAKQIEALEQKKKYAPNQPSQNYFGSPSYQIDNEILGLRYSIPQGGGVAPRSTGWTPMTPFF